ncbi:MAG: methyltransferase [Burkholderiales bacterium]
MADAMGPRERWWAFRNRWLRSPRFRAWASAAWFTRPIARRRALAAFDLCAGFVYSQVLLACVRLRLLDVLAERAQSLPVIARRVSLPEAAAGRLLDAAVALDLASRLPDGRYTLGEVGAAIADEAGILAMVEHHALLYDDLRDPVALLRGAGADTRLSGFWAYAADHAPGRIADDRVASYTALMAASQPLVAAEVLAAYDFRRHRRVLDVGGGAGAFLCAVGAAAPAAELVLFDLPPVAERAQAAFEAAGLAGRARSVGGDFLRDPLPRGADVATLVRILHDHDDAAALTLLRAIRAALPAGGTLLIAEPMSEAPGARRMGDAYFGFYLLAMGRGRPRTPAAVAALLQTAGFARAAPVATRMPLLTGLVVARAG